MISILENDFGAANRIVCRLYVVQTTDFPPLRAEDGTNGARPEDIRQESGGVYRIVVDCVAPGAHCSPHDLDYLLLRRIELITVTTLNLPILAHDLHNGHSSHPC